MVDLTKKKWAFLNDRELQTLKENGVDISFCCPWNHPCEHCGTIINNIFRTAFNVWEDNDPTTHSHLCSRCVMKHLQSRRAIWIFDKV